MEGQWIGSYTGDSSGLIVVDLDRTETGSRGTARLIDANGLPGTVCELSFSNRARRQRIKTLPLMALRPGEPFLLTPEQAENENPGVMVPRSAEALFELIDGLLYVSWVTSINSTGQATLVPSLANEPSSINRIENIISWDEFVDFARNHERGQYIFRGQGTRRRLRTAFHRTHRKDLVKYVTEDIPLAHKLLTARTIHLFDLSRSDQNGAFWNLLQHHGYPTPLLDWSYSPFVAAFFAYRKRFRPRDHESQPRILVFDKLEWTKNQPQLQAVNFAAPHFSILDALAIENARAIPQQAISTLTNVDDIESYLGWHGEQRGEPYLFAIDLPSSERKKVMIELSLMGITAGSLFPGLDGTCEELRGRLFH
jgi:hypothetical protein